MTNTKPEALNRIAFLVPHVGRSGAEVTLEQLLRGLSQDNFDVCLIAPEKQSLVDTAQEIGFKTYVRKFPEFHSTSLELGERRFINPIAVLYNIVLLIILSFQLHRWLRKQDIQILYTISIFGHLTGALACIHTRCKLIWHVHEILSEKFAGGLGQVIFGYFAKYFTDQIIAPSQAVAASIRYAKKIVIIPNGVEIDNFTRLPNSGLREELNVDPDVPLIGMIGRLTVWKGQRLFIEAIALLCNRGIKGYFVIVGDTIFGNRDYGAELQQLSQKLGVEAYISFLGFRKDIPNIIKGLDILVVPSLRPEPFGLVAIEAMAASKPVIGSNAGGLADIVVHQKTGLLFTMGDGDALAEAMEKLVLSPQWRIQYGESGFMRVQEKYTVERYVAQTIELLSVVSSKRKVL